MEGLGVMVQLSGGLAHGVTPMGLETRAWGVRSTGGPCGLGKGWQRSRLTSVPGPCPQGALTVFLSPSYSSRANKQFCDTAVWAP